MFRTVETLVRPHILPACAMEPASTSSSSTRNGKLVSITSRFGYVTRSYPYDRTSTSTLGISVNTARLGPMDFLLFSEASRKHCMAFFER
jgi:hypothetical protein